MRRLLGTALLLVCLLAASPYGASIVIWRKQRETELKAADGWLTVAGLFWLKQGENRAGTDPTAEIQLPAGRAPSRIGLVDLRGKKVFFRAAAGVPVLLNGARMTEAELKPDNPGEPDLLQIGDFTLFVIQRGGRYGIRLRDVNSRMRKEFTGLHWYPVRDQYRVVAKFSAYDQPQKLAVPNVLGQTEYEPSPGYATFQLMGHSYRLDPTVEDNELFFVFRDLTAGKTTYGAGRFLHADMPKEGKVVLDFNKAYNPPCAFTPYATCPLPPKQNRLPLKIEAGELKYADH